MSPRGESAREGYGDEWNVRLLFENRQPATAYSGSPGVTYVLPPSYKTVAARECLRCGALVTDLDRHDRFHSSNVEQDS